MICTSNRSKDFRSQIQHLEFQLTQYFSRKWSAPALISSEPKESFFITNKQFDGEKSRVQSWKTRISRNPMVWIFLCSKYLFLFYQEEPVSSCSIFKLHPGTFSFSIISDIFQDIFINSNSYQTNWEKAKIPVSYRSQEQSLYFFSVQ